MAIALSPGRIPAAPAAAMDPPLAKPSPAQTAHIVAFARYPGGGIDALVSWLMSQGARVTVVPLSYLPLDWFDHYASSYDVALVEGAFVGDDGAVIDFGLRLRRFAPDLPVIMVSSRIAASDYSTERMAICDVTLKSPAQTIDLLEALAAALENHAYWRDTRAQGRLLLPRKRPSSPVLSPPS